MGPLSNIIFRLSLSIVVLGVFVNFPSSEKSIYSTQLVASDLVIPLNWERSEEALQSIPYSNIPGGAVSSGLNLTPDPYQIVFDNGAHTPEANRTAVPVGNEWASWPQYHGSCRSTFEVRRIHVTFTLDEDIDSFSELILFSPYYSDYGNIIPINDSIYVYLNGELIGKKGTAYCAKNAGKGGSAPFANETDGWYQNGSFGSNAIGFLSSRPTGFSMPSPAEASRFVRWPRAFKHYGATWPWSIRPTGAAGRKSRSETNEL